MQPLTTNASRLPVSGIDVRSREPTGEDEVLLAQASAHDITLALEIARRLVHEIGGADLRWTELTATDLDAAILLVRQEAFGEIIDADAECVQCRGRMNIVFRLSEYIAHHMPNRPRNVVPAKTEGWFCLSGTDVAFRIPTCADELAVVGHPQPEAELSRRCIDPAELGGRMFARVEKAMETMAPLLGDYLRAKCPVCEADADIRFEPREFAFRELCDQAAFIYDDVHLIALAYHWSESEILALPRSRRLRYAEMVRQSRNLG